MRSVCAGLIGLTAQHRSGGFKQPKLSQCSHAIIETDLLTDLSIDHLQHRGAGEMHLAPGRCRKAADQEILERRTRVGAAAFPLADDVIALRDQVCGAPEVEVRKRAAEV